MNAEYVLRRQCKICTLCTDRHKRRDLVGRVPKWEVITWEASFCTLDDSGGHESGSTLFPLKVDQIESHPNDQGSQSGNSISACARKQLAPRYNSRATFAESSPDHLESFLH